MNDVIHAVMASLMEDSLSSWDVVAPVVPTDDEVLGLCVCGFCRSRSVPPACVWDLLVKASVSASVSTGNNVPSICEVSVVTDEGEEHEATVAAGNVSEGDVGDSAL